MNFFGLGTQELFVIMLLALLLFGAKRLPEIGRAIGQALRELQKATTGAWREIEKEIADTQKEIPREL